MSTQTATRTETCGSYDCQKRFTVPSDRKARYLVRVEAPGGNWFAVALCDACKAKWDSQSRESK